SYTSSISLFSLHDALPIFRAPLIVGFHQVRVGLLSGVALLILAPDQGGSPIGVRPQRLVIEDGSGRPMLIHARGQSLGRFDEPRSEEHTSELQSRGHLVCR